jgi:hypothetical protein
MSRVPRAAALVAVALAGCTSFGGEPPPKVLAGSITNDRYISRDGSFSVALPHRQDSFEYAYMQVKEMSSEGDEYVSFGPSAYDQTIWRLEVAPAPDPEVLASVFDTAFEAEIANYRRQIELAGRSPLQFESESDDAVAGHPSRQRTFTQVVPAGILTGDEPTTLTHEVLAVDMHLALVFVWVQRREDARAKGSLSARDFAESVSLSSVTPPERPSAPLPRPQ